MGVHLNNESIILSISLQNIIGIELMSEPLRQLRITHQEITNIFAALLKIPRSHKTLHPSQERSKYSDVLDWLTRAIAELLKVKELTPRQLCEREQHIIVSCLEELVQLARKECLEKSLLLEMVLEYLVGTLNAYWNALENANREVRYEFQHNSVRVERQYINELKRIQAENQELKKDKEHRWRNMFMLIKDNRIHRRQNKKLHTCINYEMEKNVSLAEQMILLREENQKLKLKLACFEDDPIRIEGFVETQLKLMELEKSIRQYPKRSKKILKNDMLKIEIQQINNLNDKIKFIIKAIEETGEIIDEFYDEETVWSNFQYNISTQTEITTDQKSTNTPITRTASTETSLFPADLTRFDLQEHYNLIVRGHKKDKKDTKEREFKQSMMMSATLGFGNRFASRREDEKMKEFTLKKMVENQFSICESVKMTIYHGRISYISTYNIEIFNGTELVKRIEEKLQTQKKDQMQIAAKKLVDSAEVEVQTESIEEAAQKPPTRSQARMPTKFAGNLCFPQSREQAKRRKTMAMPQMSIVEEVSFEYNPIKRSQHHKFKLNLNQSVHQKETPLLVRNSSDKGLDSSRSLLRNSKRLNTIDKSYANFEGNLFRKAEQQRKYHLKMDFSTQTQEKLHAKLESLVSVAVIDPKEERSSIIKEATHTNNSSNSSSFLASVDIKKMRSQIMKKPFNQSADNIMLSTIKPKVQRSSEMSPFKTVQQKKLSKFSKNQLIKHKRNATENNQGQIMVSDSSIKISRQFKMKPLHRISEVLTEADFGREEQNPKEKNALPLTITKEGEIRSMDFSKGVEKILKNMDVRRNQILTNNYSFKIYLSSYFKCLYGRDIYSNFLHFLAKSEPQEAIICFSRLSNSKSPEPYLIDIFKAFVKTIGKCYLLGESPCSGRLRQQVLKFLSSLFLEEQEISIFTSKMRNTGCYSLMGWFNSLQLQLRLNALQSQLYSLLSNWLSESGDSITYQSIQELSYFMQTDPQYYKFIIKAKYFLTDSTPIHRLSLFCYRYQWNRMLSLDSSIDAQYHKRLGRFSYQDSLRRIEENRTILLEFKFLDKCYKYWSFMSQKYSDRIHSSLLMLIQLNILEYRMKNEMPLSKDLKYLSLICEGLQKKKEFQQLKKGLENSQGLLDGK